MERAFPEYLCLTDLLDQNLSAYEFFQTLPPQVQAKIHEADAVRSFRELQAQAHSLMM